MVAYAYAQAYRDEVSHLVVMDAPLPGTAVFDRLRADPRVWHFAFHGARDVPEMLVAGRERQYLQTFFVARCFVPIDDATSTSTRRLLRPGRDARRLRGLSRVRPGRRATTAPRCSATAS